MVRSPLWLPIFIVFVAVIVPVPAGADEAADTWALGRDAFAAGDYAAALAQFERSRAAGTAGPAIYYNIAVCHYKLDNYTAAREHFAALDERFASMRSLAQYNLGLVALKLSETARAERHFLNSYQLGSDQPKLRALASTQLSRLADEKAPASGWLRVFSARAGYDDNVILQDKTVIAPETSADSPFVETYGTLRGPYPGWNGIRLDGGFFVLRYPDVDEFDQSALNTGALYELRHGDWAVDVGTHVSATTLGGDGFDRSLRFSVRATRRLNSSSSLSARYRYDDVSAIDSIFDGIEGSRHRFDLGYRWYEGDRHLRIDVTHETNDRADPDVSPDKTGLRLGYRYEPGTGWGFGGGAEFRRSDYAGITPARDEDLLQFELRVSYRIRSGWQFFMAALRADNDASDPAFTYERNQLSAGVFRVF